jgi:hypothetical protein
MRVWTAISLALFLMATGPAAAESKYGSNAQPKSFYSVVILQPTYLRDDTGSAMAQLKPYEVFRLRETSGEDLLIPWQDGTGRLSSKSAAVVLGPPEKHVSRLKRIRQAIYSDQIKARLMAGRIKEGDDMWKVEMAWGRPERSFMVNYINDEQHFVYLTPKGKPVLLRFVGGALKGPLPASTRSAAAQVESPSSPR